LERPQQMGTAFGVHSGGEVVITDVAVTHQDPGEPGQHTPGVDVGLAPAAGVQQRQRRGARHMHVLPASVHPGGRLIGADHRRLTQQQANPVDERPQPIGGLPYRGQDRRGHHPQPAQHLQGASGPPERQELRPTQIGQPRLDTRAELHPPVHPLRRLARAHRPTTGAHQGHHLVLGDMRLGWGRQVDHLPTLPTEFLSTGQVVATPTTRLGHPRTLPHLPNPVDQDTPSNRRLKLNTYDEPAPSLHVHYKRFITTTNWSASAAATVLNASQFLLLDALPLAHAPLYGKRAQYRHTPSHVSCSSRRSDSRRLHAGHRLANKRAPARLIPKFYTHPGFDAVSYFSTLHQR